MMPPRQHRPVELDAMCRVERTASTRTQGLRRWTQSVGAPVRRGQRGPSLLGSHPSRVPSLGNAVRSPAISWPNRPPLTMQLVEVLRAWPAGSQVGGDAGITLGRGDVGGPPGRHRRAAAPWPFRIPRRGDRCARSGCQRRSSRSLGPLLPLGVQIGVCDEFGP